MQLNLLVIRTERPDLLKTQYEELGFIFDHHQHGNGPFHYAAEHDGFAFEIYPLQKGAEKADNSLRLGFKVHNLEDKVKELENTNWIILEKPKKTEWGLITIIKDLDGRKVELKGA